MKTSRCSLLELLGAGLVAVSSCWGPGETHAADAPRLTVRVRETKGLERTAELVRVPLPDREGPLRVTDDAGKAAPSQVVNTTDGQAIWFSVDVPAGKARLYSIQQGTPVGPDSPLVISGRTPDQELVIQNKFYTAHLMHGSAQLDRLTTVDDPPQKLYNGLLLRRGGTPMKGPIHWTPDVRSIVRTPTFPGHKQKGYWPKTWEWNPPPGLQESRGPLLYRIRRRGPMPFFTEVNAEIVYLFSAVSPEIIVESTMRMDKDLKVQYLRNGEWVFKQGIMTMGRCKDQQGRVHEFSVKERGKAPALKRPVHPEDPWLAFYHPQTGLGFAIVRVEIRNARPDGTPSTIANYSMFVVDYGYLEACRKLVGPGKERSETLVEMGNVYYMREAVFLFDARKDNAFELVDQRAQRLRHPLEVERLTE